MFCLDRDQEAIAISLKAISRNCLNFNLANNLDALPS